MSQRPPKKNQTSRKRNKKPIPPPAMKAASPSSTAGSQDSGTAESKPGKPTTTRSSERRNARRIEAQQQAKKKKQLQLLGGGVAIAVVVAVLLILINRPSNSGLDVDYSGIAFAPPPVTLASGTPAASPAATDSQQPVTGATLGDPNAPVTMVVYADFQCPYCRLFASDTQPKIIDDFVRTGQVKLEFREFPALGGQDLTDKGNESSQSAQAVMCAAEQGQYLDYHDKLYANQRGENQGALSNGRLKQFAKELDLDTNAFNDCLDGGRYLDAVQQSKAEGQALGITATPMFIINGNVTQMTDQGYPLLKKQIEAAIETAP